MKIITKSVIGIMFFIMFLLLIANPITTSIVFYNKTPTTLSNSTNTTKLYTLIGSTYNNSTSGGIYQGDSLTIDTIVSGFKSLPQSIDITTAIIAETSTNFIDPILPGFSTYISNPFIEIIIAAASISLMLAFFGRQQI